MFTRKQYLNGECTHRQYYGQFVNAGTKARVLSGIGLEALKRSTDPHFNDIPLNGWPNSDIGWDRLVPNCPGSAGFAKAGDYYTLAGGVSLLKEAARQILEDCQ